MVRAEVGDERTCVVRRVDVSEDVRETVQERPVDTGQGRPARRGDSETRPSRVHVVDGEADEVAHECFLHAGVRCALRLREEEHDTVTVRDAMGDQIVDEPGMLGARWEVPGVLRAMQGPHLRGEARGEIGGEGRRDRGAEEDVLVVEVAVDVARGRSRTLGDRRDGRRRETVAREALAGGSEDGLPDVVVGSLHDEK